MLRFKSFIRESALDNWYSQYERNKGAAPKFNAPGQRQRPQPRRDSQHPYTDAQINKGLGDALKAYDKQHPYTDDEINKGLGDLLKNPNLPDNAAVKKAPNPIQKPTTAAKDDWDWNPEKSAERPGMNPPKVEAPAMPAPFSHPSERQKHGAMERFDQFMKTGKAPPPTHYNQPTGGPIEIPGQPGHPLHVTIHNPVTGSTISTMGQDSKVHVHNPTTGHMDGSQPQQQQAPQPQQPQKRFDPNETYSSMIKRSLGALGIPSPSFLNGPEQQAAPAPQAAPRPQAAPQAQAQSQSSGGEQRPWVGQKFNKALDDADLLKRDPEAALRKMLGNKYVAPEGGQPPQHQPQQQPQPQPIAPPQSNPGPRWDQLGRDVYKSSQEMARDPDKWMRQRGVTNTK